MGDQPTPPMGDRQELFDFVVGEGRRRLRRRRRIRVGFASLVAVGAGIGLGFPGLLSGHSGRPVIVGGGADAIPASCHGQNPPTAREARVGAAVRFGQLPVGFAPVPQTLYSFYGGETATPGGLRLSPDAPSLQVTLSVNSAVSLTPNSTIQGKPAQVSSTTTQQGPATYITWSPEPAVAILVSGSDVPESEAVAAAQSVAYQPGLAAPKVGDLGSVMPRDAVLEGTADLTGPLNSDERVITWLVDGQELGQAQLAQGTVGYTNNPNDFTNKMMRQNDPYWVVAILDYSAGPPTLPGLNGGTPPRAHVWISDALGPIGGQQETSPVAVVPADIAALVDHSTFQPCPSPSNTQPTSQPPLKSTDDGSSKLARVTAHVTQHDIAGAPMLTLQIDAGTNRGIAPGDTVYVPGPNGGLLGQITGTTATTAQVEAITSQMSSVSVSIDAPGDQALAIGHGPGKPLTLEMINQTARLEPGALVNTSGPITTGTPSGIPVGSVTTVNRTTSVQPQTAELTPAIDPSTVGLVDVILQNTASTR